MPLSKKFECQKRYIFQNIRKRLVTVPLWTEINPVSLQATKVTTVIVSEFDLVHVPRRLHISVFGNEIYSHNKTLHRIMDTWSKLGGSTSVWITLKSSSHRLKPNHATIDKMNNSHMKRYEWKTETQIERTVLTSSNILTSSNRRYWKASSVRRNFTYSSLFWYRNTS